MPSVTYNGQSFAIDGRRHWILGAAIEYARIEPSAWPQVINDARTAGFNTVLTSCPWSLHEPRKDRFTFEGPADLRRFVTLCGKAGMRVILKPGPFVGAGFDGGGLPAWLSEIPGVALREANEAFLERVITYFRKLFAQVDDLQATRAVPLSRSTSGGQIGGPILLVQSEHAWLCSNPKQAESYLRELTRIIRESGITVPLINANDLWQESPGTIDTWRGCDDLLVHLRQLRSYVPDAPLVLSDFTIAGPTIWGEDAPQGHDASELVRRLGECLAAGGQPVIDPFAGGTHFGFLAGREPAGADRFLTTSAAAGGLLNEDGSRTERYAPMKRLVMFANHFSHVFAELDPLSHPIALDVPGGDGRAGGASVIPLGGSQGRIVFVFASGASSRKVSLVLDDGIRMPVDLGDQELGWLAFDADLGGAGRLDYANLFPYAIVDRSMLVLQGPAKTEAFISINGAPLHATVPTGMKPSVLPHKGITVVICNQEQIDAAWHDPRNGSTGAFYVGAAGLDAEGRAIPISDEKVWMVLRDGSVRALGAEEVAPGAHVAAGGKKKAKAGQRAVRPRVISPSEWLAASTEVYARGESPRYATLDGPCSLTLCGAPSGYGWYRAVLNVSAGRKRLCHLPGAADRAHLYLDGKLLGVFGTGRGARSLPFELRMTKGEHSLVALLDNMGRFADGNELGEHKGLFDHLYEVRPMRAVKPKVIKADPVDPFAVRGYIAMATAGQKSDLRQVQWTFSHAKKSPILLDVAGAQCTGTIVLNGTPIAYYPGRTGSCTMRLMLSRDHYESFKRGKNELRFAPDTRQNNAVEDMCAHATLYECVDAITESGSGSGSVSWAFAKWEPPATTTLYEPVAKTAVKPLRGTPCWWTSTFLLPVDETATSFCLETKGLSKGQAYINGRNLGRYFTSTATGKAVGPQTRLTIPQAWINRDGENHIVLFDEHGFDPFKCRVICGG